jgi:hypothetical protein
VRKYYFIILISLFCSLGCVTGQERLDYYRLGFSFQGGTHENNFVGKLNYYEYQFGVGYIRRFSRPFLIFKSPHTINAGYGILGNTSYILHKTNEVKRAMRSFEVIPVARLFLSQNGFFEIGYSLEYFTDGHVINRDPSSTILYNIPRDKIFESGISIGAGYIIEIKDVIAIEPRLVMNLNNYVKSETDSGLSGDIIRNFKLIISVNLVHLK